MKLVLKTALLFAAILSSQIILAQSNDCSTSPSLPVTANCASPTNGTTAGATQSIIGCVGNADDDVWYQFTSTATTHQISVIGSASFDAVVQLFSGGCSILNTVSCMDQTFNGGTETIYATGLTIGAVYKIRIYHYFPGSGSSTFTICVTTPPAAPSNDNCAGSTLLSVNTACAYTNSTSASATQSMPGCAGNADDDVWFQFVASNSVQTITVDPSSSMDPVIQLFSGTCAGLTSLYCIDNTFMNGNEVINAVGLIPGNTYYVRVYDYYAATGGAPFQICVAGAPTAAPTNDEPCNAIPLPSVTSECSFLSFTTVGATASLGAPTPSGCVGGSLPQQGGFNATTQDVWFTVVVPPSGILSITPQPGYGISDGAMALYSGTCGALTQIACGDDYNYPGATNDFKPYILQTGLTPGATLYIRYWRYNSGGGVFGLCVSAPTNDDCANALYICDINGYSASTSAAYTTDRPCNMRANAEMNNPPTYTYTPGTCQPGGIFGLGGAWGVGAPACDVRLDNNSWIEFTAATTTVVLNVTVTSCFVGSYPSGGIQMQIFSGTNCCGFAPVSDFKEGSNTFTITANSLTVGQNYYLLVDGYAGDICNFTINALSGVAFPEIVASNELVCAGTAVTLTAPTGATSYLWSPGGQTTQVINVTPSTTTTYSCIVEGVCGYKQTLTKTISVNQLPSLINSTAVSICTGNAFNTVLNSNIPSTYTWSAAPNGNVTGETTTLQSTSTINNTLNLTIGTAQVVNYNITSTAISSSCVSNQTIAVTVNPLPISDAGTPFTKSCVSNVAGAAIGVAPVGGVTYSWSPSTDLSSSTASNPTANPSSTTLYTLTATNTSSGCTAANSVTVTVNTAVPVADVGTPFTKTCVSNVAGAVIGAAAVAGVTYSWSPSTNLSSSTASNPTANPVSTTLYTLTATNTSSGCTAANAVTVTVNTAVPVADAGADFTKTCVTNASGAVIGAAPIGGVTYSWSPALGLSSSTASNPTANPSVTTLYTLTATNTASGCTASDNVTVTVSTSTLPVADAGTPFTKTCVSNVAGAMIGVAPVGGVTYSWSPSTDLSSSTASNPTANPTATTIYTLTATNTSNGCTASDNVTITVDSSVPVANAGTPFTKTCVSNVAGAAIGAASVGGVTYSWSPSTDLSSSTASNPTANPIATTLYTLTATNTASGCTAANTVTVTVNTTIPTADAGSPFTKTCVLNPAGATIGAASFGGITYSWSPSTALSSSTASNPTANPSSTTLYTLTATNTSSGCTAANSVTVTVNTAVPVADVGTPFTKTCVSNVAGAVIGAAAVAGVTYSWSPSADLSSSTASNPTANPVSTTLYTLTATNTSSGCTAANTLTVTVNTAVPVADAISNQTLCDGVNTTAINFTGNPAIGVVYDWTNSNSAVGLGTSGSGNIPSFLTQNGGVSSISSTVTVIPTNTTNGCIGSAVSFTLNVNPLLNSSFSYPGVTYCQSGIDPSPTITGVSGGTFSGTGGLTINVSSGDINLATSTIATHTITYTTIGSCPTSSTYDITITTAPTSGFSYGQPSYCQESSDPSVVFVPGASGGVFSASPAGLSINSSNGQIDLSASAPNVYTVTNSIVASGGCAPSSSIFNVTIYSTPTVIAPPNSSICDASSVTLTGSGNAISYTWDNGISNGISFTPTGTLTYTVTGTSTNNCINTEAVTITVTPNVTPTFSFGTTLNVCSGLTVPTLPVVSDNSINGTWSPSNVDNTASDIYIFTPNAGVCALSTNFSVTVNSLPQITGTPTSTQSGCNLSDGSLTSVFVTGNPVLTFDWTNGSGISVGNSADLLNQPAGNYTLTVTDGNSCNNIFGPYSIVNPNAPTTPNPVIVNQTCTSTTGSMTLSSGFTSYELTGINPSQPLVSNSTGVFTNLLPGEYSVYVIDGSSCPSAPITVYVLNDDLLDCDGDGVTNGDEVVDGTDPNDPCIFVIGSITLPTGGDWNLADCDGDGVTNEDEVLDGTDPFDPCDYLVGSITLTPSGEYLTVDCDGDGVINDNEIVDGTDPNDPCSLVVGSITLVPGGLWNAADCDGDGVTNGTEVIDGTNPFDPCDYLAGSITLTPSGEYLTVDCDGDGVTNGDEIVDGTDPEDPCDYLAGSITLIPSGEYLTVDCDGDGVINGDEILDGTDPFDPCEFLVGSITVPPSGSYLSTDCDGDGVTNGTEVSDGTNPFDPCSFVTSSITLPTGGTWNAADCDGDGVTNGNEIVDGTDPFDPCLFLAGSVTLPITSTVNCATEIVIPSAFTPNGDLSNDVWDIINIDKVYPSNIVFIYNRWGNLLFESNKGNYANNPWDGKLNGEQLPVGSYFYIIYAEGIKSGEILNGTVSIIKK